MDLDEIQIPMRPVLVCLCKSVSRDTIVASIKNGNHSVEMIAKDTLATTGCGTCRRQVEKLLEETLRT